MREFEAPPEVLAAAFGMRSAAHGGRPALRREMGEGGGAAAAVHRGVDLPLRPADACTGPSRGQRPPPAAAGRPAVQA